MKLKSSLIVLGILALGFATVEYPDFNGFLCICDIHPSIRYNIRTARRVPLLFNWLHCQRGVLSVVAKVVVLMIKSRSQNTVVLVNNASRAGGVLKFVLVIQAIKKY